MRKKWKEKILKMTFEIFATPIDLILFTLAMVGEIGLSGERRMIPLMGRLDKLFLEGKDRIIRDALYRAKYKGWIKEDLQLTQEGRKRIFSFLPQILPVRYWDGNWYLAIFDIPERMRQKREILRINLKKLGFGQLQASCWISAINYLKNVEDLIKFHELEPYVILAQTDKLGREDSKSLANRVWKLDKINQLYEKFIFDWKKASEEEKFWLILKYFNVLNKDPQLPVDLLPDNWLGKKAYQIIKRYLGENSFSNFLK